MMKSSDFIKKIKDVADNYNTVYANGMFGQPITESIISQKARQLPKWYTAERVRHLRSLIGKNFFGFDCVCLIKAILWGWFGDRSKTNGGAAYNSNNVPDINADQMINVCKDVSTDFKNIVPGEAVWIKGHIGIYIGDGKVIECTPKWSNKVQYSNLANLGYTSGNSRTWTKHGKLPYIEYETPTETATELKTTTVGTFTMSIRVVKKGSKGNHVKAVQILLIGYGFSCGGSGADGDCGTNTEKAIKAYQKTNGLTVDGSCGPKTWAKLLSV